MNLEEALNRRAANSLLVLAGGTDFYPSLGDKSPPSDVIDTTGIKELQGISVDASVLLSEQNLHFARMVSDRAVIIEGGNIKYDGTFAELDASPDIRSAYLSV